MSPSLTLMVSTLKAASQSSLDQERLSQLARAPLITTGTTGSASDMARIKKCSDAVTQQCSRSGLGSTHHFLDNYYCYWLPHLVYYESGVTPADSAAVHSTH